MREEELVARELQARLGSDARVVGAGVHWHVEATRGDRRFVVHCFWYDEMAGLMLGMNPANTRSALRASQPPRRGAEYLVDFAVREESIAGGRTQDSDAVIASVSAWLEGRALDELERAWTYVNGTRRRMQELAVAVDQRCAGVARTAIEMPITYELWSYGNGRSCRLDLLNQGQVGCAIWIGSAQVGYGDATSDPPGVVERWLRGGTLAELAALGIASERHAELLEQGEYGRWHWAHVRDRIADPDDVLAASKPLIERLAESSIATKFFSFSSLFNFCFSASSHYPWVARGLPNLGPGPYEVPIETLVDRIEETLSHYHVEPFFGSALNLMIAPLDYELAAQGSPLRARLVQRCQRFSVQVSHGDRYCRVDERRSVAFCDANDRYLSADYKTTEQAVSAIRRWLEDRCTLDELGLDPAARKAWERVRNRGSE